MVIPAAGPFTTLCPLGDRRTTTGARSSTSSPTPGVRRLREVKRDYDPDGFFRVRHVVQP
ncbi:BBE domain-containing protein [Nonomuraea wenchangensis]|uniref:BBE domain-containing protein n=1 Tax=Nonomuraea wenchangensis TaxID=568860 RepID=UPI00384CCE8A